MSKHKLQFLRQSLILYKGKPTTIDVWVCKECKKYYIIDNKKDIKISLNGEIGPEIE